jgi:TetR/AcrR family transcriptional regulator, transcriptional repressor for nem operon
VGRTSDARTKILASAQSLIELHGYSAPSVAEICQAAGVPKGSFYYFFESKQALALAVIDERWAAERRDWEHVLHSDAELYHSTERLDTVWTNCLPLLGAHRPAVAAVST